MPNQETLDKLEQLAQLYKEGIITKEELEDEKRKLFHESVSKKNDLVKQGSPEVSDSTMRLTGTGNDTQGESSDNNTQVKNAENQSKSGIRNNRRTSKQHSKLAIAVLTCLCIVSTAVILWAIFGTQHTSTDTRLSSQDSIYSDIVVVSEETTIEAPDEVMAEDEVNPNLIDYSFKSSKSEKWLYDEELAYDYEVDGAVYKSINYKLPYDSNGRLIGNIERPMIKLIDVNNLTGGNYTLNAFKRAFLSSIAKGEPLPEYNGETPETPDYEQEIYIKPISVTDKYITMEFHFYSEGKMFMSGYYSKIFVIPLDQESFPEGIIYGKQLLLPGHDGQIISLMKKYRPTNVEKSIVRVPDNINLNNNSVVFRFDSEELGCRAEGEIEISVPFHEMKKYLQPRVLSLF